MLCFWLLVVWLLVVVWLFCWLGNYTRITLRAPANLCREKVAEVNYNANSATEMRLPVHLQNCLTNWQTMAGKDSLFSPIFSSSTSAAIAPKESQLIEKVLWTGNWQLQELSPLIWFLLGKQQAPRVFLNEIKKLRLL